jgi:hypothetical protein
MRALVTGSTVLLGNNLVRILINAGHENLGPTATISTPVYQGPISFTLQLTFRSSPTSAEFMAWRLQTSAMYRIGRGRDSRPPSPDSPRINSLARLSAGFLEARLEGLVRMESQVNKLLALLGRGGPFPLANGILGSLQEHRIATDRSHGFHATVRCHNDGELDRARKMQGARKVRILGSHLV